MPPKGRFGSDDVGWLIHTIPLSIRRATNQARARSRLIGGNSRTSWLL
jgi:hypothetical protein